MKGFPGAPKPLKSPAETADTLGETLFPRSMQTEDLSLSRKKI